MGMTNFSVQDKSIYLDANVFIYFLEGYSEFSSVLKQIFYGIFF